METEALKPLAPLDNNDALMAAGSRLHILALRHGKQHPTLQAMAVRQALAQAKLGVMGHQTWNRRSKELALTMPRAWDFREAVAMSGWKDRGKAAEAILNEWRNSPPHWAIINRRCEFFGFSMAQSRKGYWYACALTALAR